MISAGPERRDERVDAELRDDQAVARPTTTPSRTTAPIAGIMFALWPSIVSAATQRREADQVRDREVERAGEDDDGLAGGDDAQRDRALQHVHDVAGRSGTARRRS